jgi:FAD:protein FMN transferase
VDAAGGVVRRPPGVGLDAGGLAKGLFADLLAEELETHASFADDCAGDLRVGGASGTERAVQVASPFDGAILHRLRLADTGIATSGIGRRSWLGPGGSPRHHLLDPATGRPAYTGIVQATAMAPMAVEAEVRSEAAVLSGPDEARSWLVHGGVIVFDDRSHEVVEPRG